MPDMLMHSLNLKEGDVVADFGSGVGYYIPQIYERVAPSGHIIAVDIDENVLRTLQHNSSENGCDRCVSYVCCDLEYSQLQCSSRCVDYVLIITLLFQTEKKDSVMREAYRILKDGGEVVVVDWKDSFDGIGPTEEFVFPKADAWKLSLDTGFRDIKPIDLGYYHYGVTGMKI